LKTFVWLVGPRDRGALCLNVKGAEQEIFLLTYDNCTDTCMLLANDWNHSSLGF